MSDQLSPPATTEELRAAILDRYDELSKRLQQVARYVLDEPNELALETLAVIADRTGVQPSAIVRFAQFFGFEGASQMQRIFRDSLLAGASNAGYTERVRNFTRAVDHEAEAEHGVLLSEFVEGNSLALENLAQTVSNEDLRAAVRLLEKAENIYVVGFRRAFPVSSYLAYSLQQSGKRTVFVNGVGGMASQQMQTITPRDLLIAVSYQPYAAETVEAVEVAGARGAKILSISDSPVSPIAKPAAIVLQVKEAEIRTFRSLSASMCLSQALVIGFAFETSRREEARVGQTKAQST